MALYGYIRVSSQKQSYDRQKLELDTYFRSHNIDTNNITFVQEKITSYTSFRQRAIYPILKNANPGDIIYVCQLDRLGRTVEDIIKLVKFADSQEVELLTADGYRVTYKTPQGKMMLTMLAMVAEMERELRAERCQSGTDAALAEIRKHGKRIARSSGNVQTRWGNSKGTDETKRIMAIAREAAAAAKQDAAIIWRESSQAVKFVRRKKAEGWGVVQITEELGKLYDAFSSTDGSANPYATPTGCKPSKGTVSKWCREMNPLAV